MGSTPVTQLLQVIKQKADEFRSLTAIHLAQSRPEVDWGPATLREDTDRASPRFGFPGAPRPGCSLRLRYGPGFKNSP